MTATLCARTLIGILSLLCLFTTASYAQFVSPTSCSTTDPDCVYIPAISEPVQNPIMTAESSTVMGPPTVSNMPIGVVPPPVDNIPVGVLPPEDDGSTNPVSLDLPGMEDPGGFRTAALRVLRYMSGPFASLFGTLAFSLSLLGAFLNARRGMSLSGPVWVAMLTILLINAEQIVAQILSL